MEKILNTVSIYTKQVFLQYLPTNERGILLIIAATKPQFIDLPYLYHTGNNLQIGDLAQLPAEAESVHLQALLFPLLDQIVQSMVDIGDTPNNQGIDEDSS
jgi:hypothetical protein